MSRLIKPDLYKAIKTMADHNLTGAFIARTQGVSESTVSRVRKSKNYEDYKQGTQKKPDKAEPEEDGVWLPVDWAVKHQKRLENIEADLERLETIGRSLNARQRAIEDLLKMLLSEWKGEVDG